MREQVSKWYQEAMKSETGIASFGAYVKSFALDDNFFAPDQWMLDLGASEDCDFEKGVRRHFSDRNIQVVSLSPRAKKKLGMNQVAGLAQRLPFEGGTFDKILSLFSVPLRLPDVESTRAAVTEMLRVLKVGGEARLVPLFRGDETSSSGAETVKNIVLEQGECAQFARVKSDPHHEYYYYAIRKLC